MPEPRPMKVLSPMVGAWTRRLEGRPLRERIRLLPIGAAVALAAIFLMSMTLGVLDPRSLSTIQKDYYPALRASREMREILSDLQSELQSAVATRDSTRFSETDSLRGVFVDAANEARLHSVEAEDVDAIAQRFNRF